MVDRIRRIDFGVNCYVIDVEGGYVLIDTSFPDKQDKLDVELLDAGCGPRNDLRLIVLTHGDVDHAGNIRGARSSDSRPRVAIEGIREFADGGKRAARLRSLAVAANAAAREVGDPAATAAARAAGAAAASAYTHPLADVHQTKHVVGPAAHAALALELGHAGDPGIGNAEVRWAIDHAPSEAREVLLQMPARREGKTRLETLLHELDVGIRARTSP